MGKTFYIFSSGELIRKENTLCLKMRDEEKRFIPIEEVEQIFLLGENTLNSKLFDFLSQNKVVLHFLIIMDIILVVFIPAKKIYQES